MVARRTGSIYRAISAEAGTKHGYAPSVVIYDELAQAKNRDLYDVLDTSFGSRDEPLFITISTQSNDPEHILSKLIDDGLAGTDPTIVCHLHAADDDCDLDDEAQWSKANPALGSFRDREDFVAAIRKAKRLPAEEPKVRNLLLNQRVSPISTLISRAEWMAGAGVVEFEDREVDDLLREFDRIGLQAYKDGEKGDGLRLVPWGQGFKDMGPAIDALELAIFDRKLLHSNNPVMNWNIANAVATMDPAGNRKLDKDKARFRIDGAVALAMTMGLRSRDRGAAQVDIRSLIG